MNACLSHVLTLMQGSVLGPQEFLEGLGIGLRSFFAAGVLGECGSLNQV